MGPVGRADVLALALVAALGATASAPLAQTGPDPVPRPPTAGDPLPARVIPGNGGTSPAPSSALLTIDQNRLYLESAWGRRAQAQLEEEGGQIAAENERLTQLLSSEEAALTERRPDLPAAEFRRLAEDFDLRATAIRRERAQAVQALNAWADADRAAFFRAALPHMGQMMAERGAVAVLDYRTVFVSLEAIDITDALLELLDVELADGADLAPAPEGRSEIDD